MHITITERKYTQNKSCSKHYTGRVSWGTLIKENANIFSDCKLITKQ